MMAMTTATSISVKPRERRVGIIRAHLEEDAGKNLHTSGNYSQVDLNRTGTPLLEIVTEPDMNGAAEVKALAEVVMIALNHDANRGIGQVGPARVASASFRSHQPS